MKLKNLLMLMALSGMTLTAASQNVHTTYVRKNTDVELRLAWKTANYGTVKWQKSVDGGTTWNDVAGETDHGLTVKKVTSDVAYRVIVNGDEACKPFTETYLLRPIEVKVDELAVGSDRLTYEVSIPGLPVDQITEYGFCYNLSSLQRSYDVSCRKVVGSSLQGDGPFEMTCTGLLPNRMYRVRPYFKTRGGSFIYGPSKIDETTVGAEWDTEDWQVTKNSVTARFKIKGSIARPDIKFEFGTPGAMKTVSTSVGTDNVYTATVEGLKPGTSYTARLTADIDGEEQVLEKTVRTWTDYSTYAVDSSVKPVSHKIVWNNPSTRVRLSPENIQAEYPRFLRVSSDTILLAYHGGEGQGDNIDHWKNIYLQRSTDNGKTWSSPVKLLDSSIDIEGLRFWRFCNPELVKLKNGWILMPFIANANPETNANCQVMVMTSRDGGCTWSDPVTVGRGRTWEPQIVQLPGGELELLVSSEAQWWQNGIATNQQILCSRSTDNGQTWTAFTRASYNPGKRDGMPCAVLLDGNKGLAFSEESINNKYSPYIVHRDLDGEWDTSDWDGMADDSRWYVDKLGFFGGAPYMIKLPGGEVVLSAHGNQYGAVWQTGRPRVVIGDNTAHNFESRTIPIGASDLPWGEGAYYNSLFLKDDNTIWLGITHSKYDGNTCKSNCLEYLEGKVVEK